MPIWASSPPNLTTQSEDDGFPLSGDGCRTRMGIKERKLKCLKKHLMLELPLMSLVDAEHYPVEPGLPLVNLTLPLINTTMVVRHTRGDRLGKIGPDFHQTVHNQMWDFLKTSGPVAALAANIPF